MKFTRTIQEHLFIVEAKEAYRKEAEDLLIIVEDYFEENLETWYVAPVDQEIESQPLSGAKAYEIFPDYPNFYDMMHLPTDTIVIFHKGEIVSVLNEDSQDIWNL